MKSIGIDIGTTTISLVVLDTEKKMVLESRTISNGTFIETGNDWERIQEPVKIIEKAVGVLNELLAAHKDVETIGLTGQMHGIVYLDKEGECVSPLYTWQDGRGAQPEFDGKSIVQEVYEKTGLTVSTGFGLVTHLYHCRKGIVPEGAATFCSIGDYLGMKLTGRKTPLVHASNAGSFGLNLFDSEKGEFRKAVLEQLGMDTSILPEVTGDVAVLGKYKGIPVTAALGDNQASFLGSVGFRENTILLNMGTGGQISVLSDQLFSGEGIEARPFVNGKYLLVGASLCGGRAYATLEKFFRRFMKRATGNDEPLYGLLEEMAREGKEQSDKMEVSTRFNGTRINPDIRGGSTNLSEENFTPEGLTYGVLHGMIKELYDMYQIIYKATGIEVNHLVASGNGLRKNQVLQEISSEMFGAELSLAIYQEEAACGAAVSSAMGVV